MKSFTPLAAAAASVCLLLSARAGYAGVCSGSCSTPTYSIVITGGGQSIVPGTTDVGNHCDDCTTIIALPFPVWTYGQGPFTAVNLSSNGTAQMVSNISQPTNSCLPDPSHDTTVFAHWDDLRTDAQPGCSAYPSGTCGIFTSLADGTFNIEWRAVYAATPTAIAHFELRLYPDDDDFTIVFATLQEGGSGATIGAQCGTGTVFDQISCNGSQQNNSAIHFFCPFPVELMGWSVE
jgi:hypothetical protein